jgi:hypothetical protein
MTSGCFYTQASCRRPESTSLVDLDSNSR